MKDNEKDPKLKIGSIVRISNYINVFLKFYTPNWSREVFVIKKVKNTSLWIYVINDVNGKEIVGAFYQKKKKWKKETKNNLELKS